MIFGHNMYLYNLLLGILVEFQDTLVKVKEVLTTKQRHVRFETWNEKEVNIHKFLIILTNFVAIFIFQIEILNQYLFLTSKPMIYLVNLSEEEFIKKKNKWLVDK